MQVRLVTLDSLQEDLTTGSRDAFLDRYPGAFLLALGFLSVEEIQRNRPRREMAEDPTGLKKIDSTATFTFGSQLIHRATDNHPLAGCAFHLQPSPNPVASVAVGRSPNCDITIPETGVSERHCLIQLTARGVVVIDSGSTNGTTINLNRLEAGTPILLADEDILSIGRYSFQMLSSQTFYDELSLLAAL